MVSLLLYTLVSALLVSVLPCSQATPITITSSSSSGSSSGASFVNGRLVGGHCQASKNGYNSGCNDPNFAAIPNAITTVTPGDFMPPFPSMSGFPSFPNMDYFGNGLFSNFNNLSPFGNINNLSPFGNFNNLSPFGNFNNIFPGNNGFPGFPNQGFR